jgi:hypothetical protein
VQKFRLLYASGKQIYLNNDETKKKALFFYFHDENRKKMKKTNEIIYGTKSKKA